MLTPFSLLKQDKLTKSTEFGHVSRLGRKIVSSHFILLYIKNDLGHPRLGITVSKKSAKLAVHRNRIKRVIREFYRVHKSELPDVDVVLIAKHHVSTITNDQFLTDMEKLWAKLTRL